MNAPSNAHSVPLSMAESLAQRLFDVQGRATALPGYDDNNFRLESSNGERYLLKVAAAGTAEAYLDLQNQALLHIAERLPEVPWNRPLPDRGGQLLVNTEDAAGRPRWVRLLTWVPGKPWSTLEAPSDAQHREVGAFLARLDNALMDFDHPAATHHEMRWDLTRISSLWPLTRLLRDSRQRAMVEHLLLRLESEGLPRLAMTRRSVLHYDANEANIMISPDADGQLRVSGLIDFGDMIQSHTITELGIAAAYLLMHAGDLEAIPPLVKGYHAELPLLDDEIDLLYHLIAGRLVLSLLHSTDGYARNPHNDYLIASQPTAWRALEILMGIEPEQLSHRLRQACGLAETNHDAAPSTSLLEHRRRHFGRNLSLSYTHPLTIVRGSRQYLFDTDGRAYLDLVNNVCHVGHCHPRVMRAIARQAARLNTNTRYLHPNLVDYVQRLSDTFPSPLDVVFLCCTGSEANDLALRLARGVTGRKDLVVVDAAYHGHTAALIDASPYKFDSPGGRGRQPHIHVVPAPDVYRGPHRGPDAGPVYAEFVRQALDGASANGGAAGFIVESMLGCGGQVDLPPGYLKAAFEHVRRDGGVCICDEVQVGFGRVGDHMWAFEAQGVVPDIVTLGKPIGNGHPISAVVTTAEIADAFDNGMEYFNTFGGNPVSCAAGRAVLDVVRDEGLQDNARDVGVHFLGGLRELAERHALIGDVRGRGLFLGVELVRDRETLEPAADEATRIIEAMKQQGILLSTDGPLHNVLKIKPPMVLTSADADRVVETLDQVLGQI